MNLFKNLVYVIMIATAISCTDCSSAQRVYGLDVSNLGVNKVMVTPYLSSVEIIDEEGDTIGSGTIIRNEVGKPMMILTAYHVIDSLKKITIGLAYDLDKRYAHVAKANADLDLAILITDTNEKKEGPHVDMAKYGPKVGDQIWAIGNPNREIRVVTEGVVSKDKLRVDKSENGSPVVRNLYRITSPIFSGNSGGGLFNGSGELVGVVVEMGMAEGRILMIGEDNSIKMVSNMFCVYPEPGAFYAVALEDISDFILSK